MTDYKIITTDNQSTVVAEYTADHTRSDSYQSEAELEREFIRMLSTQGYEIAHITSEVTLIANLHQQLESLEEQARIVAILDCFGALPTDISTGLLAEITARQKQYEYYRDKMLAFNNLD